MFETPPHTSETLSAIFKNLHVNKTLLGMFGELHGLFEALWYIWDLFWDTWDAFQLQYLTKMFEMLPDLLRLFSLLETLNNKCKVLPDIFEILPVWFERICDVFQMLPLSLQHFLSCLRLFLVFETLPGCDFSWHVLNSSKDFWNSSWWFWDPTWYVWNSSWPARGSVELFETPFLTCARLFLEYLILPVCLRPIVTCWWHFLTDVRLLWNGFLT